VHLAARFLTAAGRDDADATRAALDAALADVVAAARAAWPGIVVPAEDFAAYLGERAFRHPVTASQAREPALALAALHASDLYLACACARGDEDAIARFEERLLARVEPALLRLNLPAWAIDETKQVLRCRFFLEGVRGGAIADFSGHGALQAWVTAAAVHAVFRVVRTPKKQTEADSVVIKAVSAPGDDLELDYLKRRYAGEFEAALRDVFASLGARERNVLRAYHLAGTGIDGVAALYRVHRVTAWRWVRAITTDLLARTRTELLALTNGNGSEVSSVLRLIQSQLDAIVRGVLATSTDSVG
jgi:RNA polymerase sigma-70 factor (ECF subfamily)